jgi:hypothetical protein
MALILKDRVQETSTTTGTGTLTLAGAVTQFQTFSSAIGNGNTTYYAIYNAGGSLWEVGIGTVGAGTLSRDTVYASSNAGAAVSFTGTLYVFCDYPATKSVYQDAIGTTTVGQLATSSFSSTTPVLSFNASNSNYAAGGTVAGSYLQTVLQNKSGTAGASTNFVLSNDLGTDSTYYGEFGMNSSVFSSGTPADFFSINNGIYYSGHDGDITLGSGNGFKTYLAWGTTGQSAHVINVTGAIGLNTSITGSTNFGTSGQVLTSGGSAATPTWTTPAIGTVTSITSTTLTVGGTTAIPTVNLTSGIATAGTTGSATLIPVVTIDTYGRVTSITTATNPQGTVTSVAALTLGTTGTDLSSTVATGTTTPVITLNVPTASATNRGALSSTDWTTFNSKGSGTVTSVNLTASTGISVSGGPVTSSGSITVTNTAPMTYPGAGIGNSTGSAWGTSYTTTGTGTVLALATTPAITNPTVTNYVETLYAPAAGSSFTISLANGTVQEISLNANGTITLPSSVAGKSYVIIVTYSGAYTLTWAGGSTIKWPGGTAPTASSANGKFDIFTFFCDGTNTYGNSFGLNY